MRQTYGATLPHVDLNDLSGSLIVVEGGDGAGRSTQIRLLKGFLEQEGYPVIQTGIKRSSLLSEELTGIMKTNMLCPRTFSLFYATDFYDQLERGVIPALRAGFVVLCDRYLYTLMARGIVRGSDAEWLSNIYNMALIPDAVLYLDVSPKILAERIFLKKLVLDYWESGLDLGNSENFYTAFISYQSQLQEEFSKLQRRFAIKIINGEAQPLVVHEQIKKSLAKVLTKTRSRRFEHRNSTNRRH